MKQLSILAALGLGLLVALGCDDRTDPIVLADSGPVDAGPTCGDPVGLPPTPGCAAATAQCIGACPGGDGGTCIMNCLNADPNTDNCSGCLDFAIFSCQSRQCMSSYSPADCCAAANCSSDGTGPCFEAGEPCESEATAFRACVAGIDAGMCGAEVNGCFPPAGGFLPGIERVLRPETLQSIVTTRPGRFSPLQSR